MHLPQADPVLHERRRVTGDPFKKQATHVGKHGYRGLEVNKKGPGFPRPCAMNFKIPGVARAVKFGWGGKGSPFLVGAPADDREISALLHHMPHAGVLTRPIQDQIYIRIDARHP